VKVAKLSISATGAAPVPKLSAAWSRLGLKVRNKMAKKRSGPFSLKEERQLIRMAATSATLEEAAAIFQTSVNTIENKCKRLGIQLRRRGRKRSTQEWTEAEVHQLRMLAKRKVRADSIAKLLGRYVGSVKTKALELRLILSKRLKAKGK
jgi:hypothetical protein